MMKREFHPSSSEFAHHKLIELFAFVCFRDLIPFFIFVSGGECGMECNVV
jgi:hypothetical protein